MRCIRVGLSSRSFRPRVFFARSIRAARWIGCRSGLVLFLAGAACADDETSRSSETTEAHSSCSADIELTEKICWWSADPTACVERNRFTRSDGAKGGSPSSSCSSIIPCDAPANLADLVAAAGDADVRAALASPAAYPAAPEVVEYETDRDETLYIRLHDREIRLYEKNYSCGADGTSPCDRAPPGLLKLASVLETIDAAERPRCEPM